MLRLDATWRFIVSVVILACLVATLAGAVLPGEQPVCAAVAQELAELDDGPSVADIGDAVFFTPAAQAGMAPVRRTLVEGAVRFSSRFPPPRLRPPRIA